MSALHHGLGGVEKRGIPSKYRLPSPLERRQLGDDVHDVGFHDARVVVAGPPRVRVLPQDGVGGVQVTASQAFWIMSAPNQKKGRRDENGNEGKSRTVRKMSVFGGGGGSSITNEREK